MTDNSHTPSPRRWIWIASGLVVFLLILYSYFHQTPLKVHAVTVKRGAIRSLVSTNGKVEPIQNFEAHAPIATTVKRLVVKEGDHVRKGQLLLELDDSGIRSQAARAQVQIKTAQANLAATKNSGTQEELIHISMSAQPA